MEMNPGVKQVIAVTVFLLVLIVGLGIMWKTGLFTSTVYVTDGDCNITFRDRVEVNRTCGYKMLTESQNNPYDWNER